MARYAQDLDIRSGAANWAPRGGVRDIDAAMMRAAIASDPETHTIRFHLNCFSLSVTSSRIGGTDHLSLKEDPVTRKQPAIDRACRERPWRSVNLGIIAV
ncbi:hypothetical protein [Rhizobium miluonense]|uniref:hypothetical protein n=1 Tax=Rhizobium miluonense TaxID=411945 RepID=UPI000B81A26F|nr:hypothetical protein [Rhizobium miluonense]